jgi:outer membrane receptor protein involved in Fe transport
MRQFIVLAVCLLTGVSVLAQTPSASVTGRVVDATGAVLPGVAVKITNLDTNQAYPGISNEIGDYTVPYLNPGRYTLEATREGFRAYKHSEFVLAVDQVLRLDFRMEVGATTESITVTDTPVALNTESGTRGDVTINEEITEIPLNGRDFSDLAYLTGGVVPRGDGADGAYAVNGARADNFSFLIDGMNNTQRRNTGAVVNLPLEGVQEFKMITSGYSAEYGRYAGGVLSVVTKSGGNRLRGSLYEFLRNDLPDARGFFDPEKSKLRRNQFGATLSGPVVLPKLYNGQNRTFFLFSWESLRQVQGQTQLDVTPSAAMLKGDFSRAVDAYGTPLVLNDPIAKKAFPGNQIPADRLNPVSLKLAAYYPLPTPSLAGANNYAAQANSSSSSNNFTMKADHSLSSRDRLTLSTFWRPNQSTNPFNRTPVSVFGTTSQNFELLSGIRYLRTFTPTVVNEASVSFSRKTLFQGWPGNTRNWAAEIGFAGTTTNPVAMGLPQVDVSGYMSIGHAYDLPKVWSYNNYQYSDAITWVHGRHTMKFGGDLLHYQYFGKQYGYTRGRLTFTNRFTGEPMADFLLGFPNSTKRQLDAGGPYHLVSNYAGFVQDDYKVTPTLTLNLGLRYELLKPAHEKYGAWSAFVPQLGKVVVAGHGMLSEAQFNDFIQLSGLARDVVMASDVGLPATLAHTDYNDLAPRFGFAWRPFGNARSVIRGGYGIFYGSSSLYRTDELSDIYPFSVQESYSASASNPQRLTVSDPWPAAYRKVSGITSTSGLDVNARDQYLQSWNLTVERELGGGTVLEAAYAGSKGTHLPRRYDINQPIGRSVANPNGTRLFPDFSTISYFMSGSNSIYNAGSVTLRRRFTKQIFLRAAYTYAKSIDETSNTGGTIAGNYPSAQDSHNLHGERDRSDFDIGHTFVASFIWQPKLPRHFLLKDWQLSGTTKAYTGPPFTPKVSNYNATNGEANRPDRIAKGTLSNPSPDEWFDRSKAAFPPVPTGGYRFGNSGRNILDAPGTLSIDAALSRRFRFTESKALQFRWETFNVPNRANFGMPETNVDVINAATISTTKAPRVFQLGLRFEF